MAALPRPSIDNAKTARPPEKLFAVWDPAGNMHMVPRQNMNDLVRHGSYVDGVLTPWSQVDPAVTMAKLSRHQVVAGDDKSILVAANTDRPATPHLDALRKELAELGGVADPTWGIKHLQTVIEAKKQGLVAPMRDADVDNDE